MFGKQSYSETAGQVNFHVSHKEQVTFSGPFLGVPNHLDYTRNWPEPS